MKKRIDSDHLLTLQDVVHFLNVIYAIELFTEGILLPLHRFYQNWFLVIVRYASTIAFCLTSVLLLE